ncbi:MAG: P-loop NTPase [Defluviitaleaceae bacterium]|nr:P-loop NTPase [Defluviitaleaceae bacterium]
MSDQANRLRDIIKAKNEGQPPEADGGSMQTLLADLLNDKHTAKPTAKVITITSGKGGVGKTNFTVNLAIALGRMGKRVVVIDADFGLANIEVLLGIVPKRSFADVFAQKCTIQEVLTPGPLGVNFISGGSGLSNMSSISNDQLKHIIENFDVLDAMADFVLIDTGAGISKSVMAFVLASNESIVITTPEPTSITDAYAVIKTAKEEMPDPPTFKIVVNRVESKEEGFDIYHKLSRVCSKFLMMEVENLGFIPYDHNLVKAVKKQTPVSVGFPQSGATLAINEVCRKLLFGESALQDLKQEAGGAEAQGGMKSFVKRLTGLFKNKA